LQDHLSGQLNSLRFSEEVWEGRLFRNAGFYTNRIRYTEMLALFEQAGFDCNVPRINNWDQLPTPRARMDKLFRSLPDSDLLVKGFDLVLTHQELN
jgi:hypothetical protein